MSDAAIDSYVKIYKANGATDKEINAALLSGKAMKKEDVTVDESAKEMVDPIKNSKGLHNSPKPLGQATIKELEASKAWYQETIEKYKETIPSFSVQLKQLLALVNTELASRIGKKKNESVEIDEATTPHTPTDLYKKASKAGFSTGSVMADKVFRVAVAQLGDEELARRGADAFFSGVARLELGKARLEAIAKAFE
jgi:hypothetical protein